MDYKTLINHHIEEIHFENVSARKCLERVPESLYKFKPHEKSMEMGYLTLLVADIPRWITVMVRDSFVDFATYSHFKLSTADALLKHYDENIKEAIDSLEEATGQQLKKEFTLKNGAQILHTAPMLQSIGEAINHWVHHRGQLTVYMRLNDIAVPSIYGPSADDKKF